ncbi:MAG: patatin-like phospholipase family protein [Deferribacterales bacterium]|nr:patatin-like phospholipase family protein [Deferribacterales bacterium]
MGNFFTVKNIALALGSGSAKGAAHIGVIEAFLAAGCRITALSGTSMGAIVASYCAFNKLHTLKQRLLNMNKSSAFLKLDFSLAGGLLSGKKIMSIFEEDLGNTNIEDAPIPLFITAANLDTGEKHIFDNGPLIPAIRASISIPGIFKPFFYNNAYYVDGALIDPVPSKILAEKGYKNIIAVHLNKHLEHRPQDKKFTIAETMGRAVSITAKALAEASSGGERVLIKPNLAGIGMFEIHKTAEIINIGRNAADEIIALGALRRKPPFFR